MDNSNNNNCFISPNRFGRLFYEDNNNDDNESKTNNTDSTKTLPNDQINKENFARKYNNNDKNKNTGRPEVVINQYPENQTVYPRKRIVPEQILIVNHWVTLKQTVATSKFSVIAFQKVYELNKLVNKLRMIMLVYVVFQGQHLINYFIIWMSILINTQTQ